MVSRSLSSTSFNMNQSIAPLCLTFLRSGLLYGCAILVSCFFAGCIPQETPGPDPDEEPVIFGCKNNATGKANMLNLQGQSIINQMKQSDKNEYDFMWEFTTYSCCPNGSLSGYFYLELEQKAETYFEMTGYRLAVNEDIYEDRYFSSKLISIAGLDLSAYDAQYAPEKVCIGCQDEQTFECRMKMYIKVTPPAGNEVYNYIANNVTAVKINLNYTGY